MSVSYAVKAGREDRRARNASAYAAGVLAYPDGGNPYTPGTLEHHDWRIGFKSALRHEKLDRKWQRRLGDYSAWPVRLPAEASPP